MTKIYYIFFYSIWNLFHVNFFNKTVHKKRKFTIPPDWLRVTVSQNQWSIIQSIDWKRLSRPKSAFLFLFKPLSIKCKFKLFLTWTNRKNKISERNLIRPVLVAQLSLLTFLSWQKRWEDVFHIVWDLVMLLFIFYRKYLGLVKNFCH